MPYTSVSRLSDAIYSPTTVEAAPDARGARRRSFLLVFCCTIIGAFAQILVKEGTRHFAQIGLSDVIHDPLLFFRFALQIASNFKLFCGYCLYGVNTFLMALALRGRELSRLYPIIALTYVWVTLLSLFMLSDEHLNFFRITGITFIVGGVSLLGLKK